MNFTILSIHGYHGLPPAALLPLHPPHNGPTAAPPLGPRAVGALRFRHVDLAAPLQALAMALHDLSGGMVPGAKVDEVLTFYAYGGYWWIIWFMNWIMNIKLVVELTRC